MAPVNSLAEGRQTNQLRLTFYFERFITDSRPKQPCDCHWCKVRFGNLFVVCLLLLFSWLSLAIHYSFSYRDIVMNFVCNLRRLGIYDQLVIAAFDEEMYRFGFAMGLPTFFYQVCCCYTQRTYHWLTVFVQGDDIQGLSARDLEYGSRGFKRVTKLKSQVDSLLQKAAMRVFSFASKSFPRHHRSCCRCWN